MQAAMQEPTASDAAQFEDRLKSRIESLPGGKAPITQPADDSNALDVVQRMFSPGDDITLYIVNDEGEVEQVEATIKPVRFMTIMPVINNLVREAVQSCRSDFSEGDIQAVLFDMAAQENSPVSNALADVADKILGQEKGRHILHELEPESFFEVMEVAMSIFPLGKLARCFTGAIANTRGRR